jgi:hypothetical protein
MAAKFQPGDKVRLTGKFLRNTGQIAGGEGQSKWTVVPCGCGLCRGGDFVAVNQSTTQDFDDGKEHFRHINAGNLVKCGVPDRSVDEATAPNTSFRSYLNEGDDFELWSKPGDKQTPSGNKMMFCKKCGAKFAYSQRIVGKEKGVYDKPYCDKCLKVEEAFAKPSSLDAWGPALKDLAPSGPKGKKIAQPTANQIRVKCGECGKVFNVSTRSSDPHCPKCKGVDVDIAPLGEAVVKRPWSGLNVVNQDPSSWGPSNPAREGAVAVKIDDMNAELYAIRKKLSRMKIELVNLKLPKNSLLNMDDLVCALDALSRTDDVIRYSPGRG